MQADFDGWFRVDVMDGRKVLRLAMRYTLASQMRVTLPGIDNQQKLIAMATRYGLRGETYPTDRLTGGERLLVLSAAATSEITDEPDLGSGHSSPTSDSQMRSQRVSLT